MKKIQQIYLRIKQQSYAAVAAQVLLAIVLSAIPFSNAGAVQLTSRSIQMSDSGPSANSTITTGVGSGTNVIYNVNFTPSTTSIAGIVVDFCSNTPLVGDTCTAPTGFNINRTTTTAPSANQTNLGTGAFAVETSDGSNNNRVILTRTTAAAPTGGAASIQIGTGASTNGFTNPSTTGTFYARIYTYAAKGTSGTAGTALGHNSNTPTGYVDYGGVALSTASVITITARVQENIIFCVFGGAAPNANCAAAGGSTSPALTLGHLTTGTVRYIDSSAVDTISAYTQLSTNAGSGATVRMHSSSTTGGLDNGGNSIPPVNSGANSAAAITAGTAAFGLFVAAGSGGTGTVTADTNYNNGTSTNYGMDSTTSGDNVTTSYGDRICYSTAPVSNVGNVLTFAATASNITPAGLYSANLSLVATGTF